LAFLLTRFCLPGREREGREIFLAFSADSGNQGRRRWYSQIKAGNFVFFSLFPKKKRRGGDNGVFFRCLERKIDMGWGKKGKGAACTRTMKNHPLSASSPYPVEEKEGGPKRLCPCLSRPISPEKREASDKPWWNTLMDIQNLSTEPAR